MMSVVHLELKKVDLKDDLMESKKVEKMVVSSVAEMVHAKAASSVVKTAALSEST